MILSKNVIFANKNIFYVYIILLPKSSMTFSQTVKLVIIKFL